MTLLKPRLVLSLRASPSISLPYDWEGLPFGEIDVWSASYEPIGAVVSAERVATNRRPADVRERADGGCGRERGGLEDG